MRAPFIATLLAFAVFGSFGCSSSEEGGGGTVPPRDTGLGSETSKDTGTDDSKPLDTGGDTKTDTGGSKCDEHPGDECDMVKQNCADTKQTCEYNPTAGHNTCSTRPAGTGAKGEPCSTTNPCDKGLFCYQDHCSPACCPGDSAICGAKGSCTLSITDTDKKVIYHVCSYSAVCNPFKYDCAKGSDCYYDSDPDVFKCATPTTPGTKPGGKCSFRNDCGESQGCFKLTTGGDTSGVDSMCYLFCWVTKPSGFTPGTTPDGRFPADGTCVIGGVDYGKCTTVGTIGGGLGLCLKP